MFEIKLYLYDSEAVDYKGEDLSPYILTGAQNTEDITEELDVTEITLQGYPQSTAFTPETKFIVEVLENGESAFVLHRCVQEDVVEKPILTDDEYYTHALTLIEPAVVAQKRIVDDISVTYKLKDVSLETRSEYNLAAKAVTTTNNATPATPPRGFADYVDRTQYSNTRNTSFGKYFEWKKASGTPDILFVYTDTNGVQQKKDLKYINYNDVRFDTDEPTKKYAQFEIPVPHIMWGIKDSGYNNPDYHPQKPAFYGYADIGVANFRVKIVQEDMIGRRTEIYNHKFLSNSELNAEADTTFPYAWACGNNTIPNSVKNHFLCEHIEPFVTLDALGAPNYADANFFFRKYTTPTADGGQDLKTANVLTANIEIQDGYSYYITMEIEPANEAPNVPFTAGRTAYAYTANQYSIFEYIKLKNRNGTGGIYAWIDVYANNGAQPQAGAYSDMKASCLPFTVYTTANATATLSAAIPYTAYNLIVKAIANSDNYYKEAGKDMSSLDFVTSPYPFYVSEKAGNGKIIKSDLEQTRINEAFYHQKNLWEILLEVGKYCHAIPEITFGDNDKFEISFNKLGGTNVSYNNTTRKSIMNFRRVDDYVAACSSYVDNLVQLGGRIVEKVAPKKGSGSDDYLVSNDTACIKTAKNMIELLSVKAIFAGETPYNETYVDEQGITRYLNIAAGQEADLTEYIYEKSIYGLLSVNKNDYPNKGIAMYYELGTNEILGGDYQLPAATPNPYSDYAFKKILFAAFAGKYYNHFSVALDESPWYKFKVNDFIFEVTYRTKDTARVESVRPDLRHYIITSKHDRYPVHRQFNNQQDILVDSVAFGANMFGKLIRTGNENYKEQQWCRYLSEVMHKGELYAIEGEWCYVAKATHIFFPDHIESIIEYSKDYNQLSAIIGIPSEPRFWEISERKLIDREVAINDFIVATTDPNKIDDSASLIADIEHTKNLIFGGGGTFLKWALTHFHGDPNIPIENQANFGLSDGYNVNVMSPISAYSCGNTLTYEWDMEDNFSAGDDVSREVQPTGETVDEAYRTLRAVQYCDRYGKAALFDFALYGDLAFTAEQVRSLPKSPILLGGVTNAINAWYDATKPAFASNWLVTTEAGGTTITPQDGQIYEIISYMNGTVKAVTSGTSTPTGAQLDAVILAQTGSAAQNGDVVLFGLTDGDGELTEFLLYTRVSGLYTHTEIWNNTLGAFNGSLFVRWSADANAYLPLNTADNDLMVVSNAEIGKSIVLFKDCREVLHFNYNLMQLTDSDRFVLSPFFFTEKTNTAKVAVLSEEVNKMSNGYINSNFIIAESPAALSIVGKTIVVDMSWIDGLTYEQQSAIKSVVIMESGQGGIMQKFTIAKNAAQYELSYNWYFGAPNKDNLFTRRQ